MAGENLQELMAPDLESCTSKTQGLQLKGAKAQGYGPKVEEEARQGVAEAPLPWSSALSCGLHEGVLWACSSIFFLPTFWT